MSTIKQNFFKHIFWGTIFVAGSQIISMFLGYIIRVILANKLDLFEFGLYNAVFALIGSFLIFRDFGMGVAVSKLAPELNVTGKKNQAHSIIIAALLFQTILSFVIITFLLLTKDWFAQNFFREQTAANLIVPFSAYVIFSALVIWMKNVFRVYKKTVQFSAIEPIRNILNILLILIFLKFFDNALTPALAVSFSWALVFLAFLPSLLSTHKFFHHKIEAMKVSFKKLFGLGIPIMFNDFAERMITRIDVIVLTYFTTLDTVGIYSIVFPTTFLFLLFGKSIIIVIFPYISELKATGSKKSLEAMLRMIYKYSFLVTLPAVVIGIVFSKEIINILFGSNYVSGYLAFNILIIGTIFNMLAIVNNFFLIGFGKPKTVSKSITIAMLFNLVGNIIIIPIIGMEGAAATSVISYLIMFGISTYNLRKDIEIKVPYFEWFKTFVLSAIIILVAIYIKDSIAGSVTIKLSTIIPAIILTYFVGCFIFKLVDLKEINKYRKIAMLKTTDEKL